MIHGRVLIIAGSDSGGGAGIQADIKTATALGAYAMTAVAALTAQDTSGVRAVHAVPPEFVRLQIALAMADIGADSIKTGMLADAAMIEAVCAELSEVSDRKLVVDPVMVAKGGARLLTNNAVGALRSLLLPMASVITPNLPEAEALTGVSISCEADMAKAAEALLRMGAPCVLLKGGHLPGAEVVDLLVTPNATIAFRGSRINSTSTHGTGCTLATAMAVGLAQALPLPAAVARARGYVRAAILAAPGLGHGHGPLDHTVTIDPARIAALGAVT